MPAKHDAPWDQGTHRQRHAPALSDAPVAMGNCNLASGPWLPTALLVAEESLAPSMVVGSGWGFPGTRCPRL